MGKYLRSLADKNSDSLGFLPAQRYDEYLAAGQVLVERENGEPCGYIIHGVARPVLRIYQTCIQFDARRIEHATALVRQLIADAIAAKVERIRLHCADDLPANDFWHACGFMHVGNVRRDRKKGRLLRRWEMILPEEGKRIAIAKANIEQRGLSKLHAILQKNDSRINDLRTFKQAQANG